MLSPVTGIKYSKNISHIDDYYSTPIYLYAYWSSIFYMRFNMFPEIGTSFTLCSSLMCLSNGKHPYPLGLFHWHCDNHVIATAPVKES